MSAAAFAAVPSFQVVLFCETSVAFRGDVVITFLQFDFLLEKTHSTKIPFYYLAAMIVLVLRGVFRKGILAMALWPFILVREASLKKDSVLMFHERIHLRQQLEMLVILFYLWYVLEYLIRRIGGKGHRSAYRSLSFEREAYSNEKDPDFLKSRPFWNFLNYI